MREKYSHKPLKDFSPVTPFFILPFYRKTAGGIWDFIYSIVWHFFVLQIRQKIHLSHRSVIYVDTQLDEKIPFCPEKVKIYMGFIPFFIKPVWMLSKRLGIQKASATVNEYMHFLARLYKDAASVYRFCFTTTHRPNYKKDRHFRAIHFFDPHLLCVPSLHVAIAAGSYAFFKKRFSEGLLPGNESEFRLSEIKQQAIDIIESVLFVKQHSVNCIPIAFYMLTASAKNDFLSIEDTVKLMDVLFQNSPEISENVRKEINEYFRYMYERTLLENCYSDNWQDCIKHWLIDYAKATGQKISVKQ